jgi:hypothetical protein
MLAKSGGWCGLEASTVKNLATKMRGLSEPTFQALFGTEEQCVAVLFEMRWGRGFICERCGCRK